MTNLIVSAASHNPGKDRRVKLVHDCSAPATEVVIRDISHRVRVRGLAVAYGVLLDRIGARVAV